MTHVCCNYDVMAVSEMTLLLKTFYGCYVTPRFIITEPFEDRLIGPVSVSRCMARLRATGADLGTGHKNNIRWMTVVTSD